MSFPADAASIQAAMQAIDPVAYGRTRNFGNGAVTRLSPYISRGVISTRQVMQHVLSLGLPFEKIEKLLQELAWRDYWQQVWIAKGDDINSDLRQPQAAVSNHQMPAAINRAITGIEAVDAGIKELYQTGYMHNHMRMYVAAIACNQGNSHWRVPARWMYYHLLDGDWASNALSWQWVAGANAGKKYIANQENINKYFASTQRGTFLDVDYATLADLPCPEELLSWELPELKCSLPTTPLPELDSNKPTLLYNYYNLDRDWRAAEDANRVLLLEPALFERYPVSEKCMKFVRALAAEIPGLQTYCGSFNSLAESTQSTFIYKEHPLNSHYHGTQDNRDWMFEVTGYYRSFFAFWKQCKKRLPQ